jgi:hypothetical protein
VNERYKGIHVINNANPVHPIYEGFILVPGCMEMAVKENILYLDNAVDLVCFDLDSKQVIIRFKSVFSEPRVPDEKAFEYHYPKRPKGYILVEWKKN